MDPDGRFSINPSAKENVSPLITLPSNEGSNFQNGLKLVFGLGKMIGGALLSGASISGGLAATAGTGGVAVAPAVALASAGAVAGGALAFDGVSDVSESISYFAQNFSEKFTRRDGQSKHNENKQIDQVAKQNNINEKDFGKFIEAEKEASNRGNSQNYTWQELQDLAKLYIDEGGK